MLNKKDIEILTALCKMLGDGYEVITVDDIAQFKSLDAESLSDISAVIKALDAERMISLKYSADGCFCLAVLPIGRRKVVEMSAIPVAKLSDKAIIKTDDSGGSVIAMDSVDVKDAEAELERLVGATTVDDSVLPPAVLKPKIGLKAFFSGLCGGIIGSGIVTALYYVFDVVLALF